MSPGITTGPNLRAQRRVPSCRLAHPAVPWPSGRPPSDQARLGRTSSLPPFPSPRGCRRGRAGAAKVGIKLCRVSKWHLRGPRKRARCLVWVQISVYGHLCWEFQCGTSGRFGGLEGKWALFVTKEGLQFRKAGGERFPRSTVRWFQRWLRDLRDLLWGHEIESWCHYLLGVWLCKTHFFEP